MQNFGNDATHMEHQNKANKRPGRVALIVAVALAVVVVVGVVSSGGARSAAVSVKNMAAAAVADTQPDKFDFKSDFEVMADLSVPSLSCTGANGYDLYGHDIAYWSHVTTLTHCQNLCKLNGLCRCYTYQASLGNCWLKNGPCNNWGKNSALESGLCRGTQRPSQMTCTANVYVDLPGNDIQLVQKVSSLAGCQTNCKANLNCKCYTYQAGTGNCWLKQGACNNYRHAGGLQSGICTDSCA